MKKLQILLSLFAAVLVFSIGFELNKAGVAKNEVEQVHLSCWDTQETSSVGRIRLQINRSLQGLAWLSTFEGSPSGEGTVSAETSSESKSSYDLHVTAGTQSFTAKVTNMVFQPHIKTLTLQVLNGEETSSLSCRKINVAAR